MRMGEGGSGGKARDNIMTGLTLLTEVQPGIGLIDSMLLSRSEDFLFPALSECFAGS